MFFYVDESGHTGGNLFDAEQPMLFYGVLSSATNIDIVAEGNIRKLRTRLGVQRLHASELGNGGLSSIASELLSLQRKFDLRFDLYRVNKPDHAVICFFDQVFDQGMNPAVLWHHYWTPLRYMLLVKLACLFDDPLARRAWAARINLKSAVAETELATICTELIERLHRLPDARSREVIGNALQWASLNPGELQFNASSKNEVLSITPNMIGFQSVMMGIANRVKASRAKRPIITVDQQSQFNKTQKSLAQFYANAKGTPVLNGPGLPAIDFAGMPDAPIRIASSMQSAGLELVDLYLWIFKRFLEQKNLAPELYPLIAKQAHRGRTDEISLSAVEARWSKWFDELSEPTPEQLVAAEKLRDAWENQRSSALAENEGLLGAG